MWVAKLLGYDFEIEYKIGASNAAADALSRRDGDGELATLSNPEWVGFSDVEEEQAKDEYVGAIMRVVRDQPGSKPGFELVGSRLFYHGRVVLPASSVWIPKLLTEFHDTLAGGHTGVYRMYRRIAGNVY